MGYVDPKKSVDDRWAPYVRKKKGLKNKGYCWSWMKKQSSQNVRRAPT
jgi:hypothetical protein